MTSDTNKKGKTIKWYVEAWSPAFFAFVTFGLLIYFKGAVMLKFDSGLLDITDVYFAIFSWAVLQVGFCFAVYALIISKIKGFMYDSIATKTMKDFKNYLMRGYWIGILLTIITLLFIVLRPDVSELFLYNYFILAAWFSFFLFSFLCFIRIVVIFRVIAKISEND